MFACVGAELGFIIPPYKIVHIAEPKKLMLFAFVVFFDRNDGASTELSFHHEWQCQEMDFGIKDERWDQEFVHMCPGKVHTPNRTSTRIDSHMIVTDSAVHPREAFSHMG